VAWAERLLKHGDRIGIEVRRAAHADAPVRATRVRRVPVPRPTNATTFLSVDLDVRSREPLDALVAALGDSVVLHVGREGRHHVAHLELAAVLKNPGRIIKRFVSLIERLPDRERRRWNAATHRVFNVGIQAGHHPHCFELRLEPAVVAAAAGIGASVVTTVYSATARSRHTRPSASRKGRV
jgi:hypothetical protein